MRIHERTQQMVLRSHAFCFGVCVVALSIAAVVSAAHDVHTTLPEPAASLLSGTASRAFESQYDRQFPVRRFSINLWSAIDLTLFGEQRTGVVLGGQGWLYSAEEFALPNRPEDNVRAHLREIAMVDETLRASGIGLLVALVPDKAFIYSEHLHQHPQPALRKYLNECAEQRVSELGIKVVDLGPTLLSGRGLRPTFLRTDTHWTPFGARRAADTIAASVRQVLTPPRVPVHFETNREPPRQRRGDLFNFLPLTPWFSSMLPDADTFFPEHTVEVGEGGALLAAPVGAPRIALVGTSFSAIADWNFDGALEEALGERIPNYAREGQGPFAPMQAYLRSVDFRREPPRLVIWEIPIRYLPAAPRGDGRVDFAIGAADAPDSTSGDVHDESTL